MAETKERQAWTAVSEHPGMACKPGQPRLPSYNELEALCRSGYPSSAYWIEWAANEIIQLTEDA